MNIKAILASTLIAGLLAATAGHAEGRAGNVYDNAQKATSAEIVKVSFSAPVANSDELPSR